MPSERVTLKSGRTVVIRPIGPDDEPGLAAAYDRLSPESKYRRFLAPKPHLSMSETRYLVHIDGRDHVALVATRVDDPKYILAVARFVRSDVDPAQAEFAVVVGDPFQQEGLATALMERLGTIATERGITSFKATMLAENVAAHHLFRGFATGSTAERHLGTVNEIEVDLTASIARFATGCDHRAVPWKLTVRAGPKVERSRFDSLDAALEAAERRGREIAQTAHRPAIDAKIRQFEPIQQVAARIEVAGPERMFPSARGGLDVRGDGSTEAYVGGVRRQVVKQRGGETPYTALRRTLTNSTKTARTNG